MGRRRKAQAVPAVEENIQEVITTHRQTTRGVRTTEKVVPVLKPSKDKPGQPSHSKKGKERQIDPKQTGQVTDHFPITDNAPEDQFFDEQVDSLPDLEPDQGRPQANVSIGHYLCRMETLMRNRL